VFEVIDLITASTRQGDDLATIVKAEFCAATDTDALETELSVGDVIAGLRDATHLTATGIWVDINETRTVNSQAKTITQTHIGVNDPRFDGYYNYTGDDAAEALTGYDQWLQNHYSAIKQARLDEGDDGGHIIESLTAYRLLEIATGADYHLALLCPEPQIDAVIESLAIHAINARPQTTDPWPGASESGNYNLCEHIEQRLINRHGFEWDKDHIWLLRHLDDQISVIATFLNFEAGPDKGRQCSLDLGLSLVDFNRAFLEVVASPFTEPYRPVISDALYEGYRPFVGLCWEVSKSQVDATIDRMIESVLVNANRDFITRRLADQVADPASYNPTGQAWLAEKHLLDHAISSAVDGWNPDQHDDLFGAILSTHDETHHDRINEKLDRLKAWIADNPDGLRP